MKIKNAIQDTLVAYENIFGINESSEAFRLFLASHDNVTSRKNLAGHVTGSALVWHKPSDTVLRVLHAKIKRWVFSAGGHIDDGEFPWQTSIRELQEETGIKATPLFDMQKPLPLIMDAHTIPASVKKSEPAHWHYDMIYLYSVDVIPEIQADPKEITEFHWVKVDNVTTENSPINLREQMLRYGA